MVAKNILLGVTGGVAAYKSVQLVRLLKQAGFSVKVVMTQAAESFVTPLCFQAISGERVFISLFDQQSANGMAHIELAKWADLILIAPASANTIAKIRTGFADDLLSTTLLASSARIVLAPAMNQQMWLSPATQENVRILTERGVKFLGPASGTQACGDVGEGRMVEPEVISAAVLKLISMQAHDQSVWSHKKILITAGPTREPIDPIRFISNRSTGKMGYALAEAAAALGADVILIAGPTALPDPVGVCVTKVMTAQEMHQAVFTCVNEADVFIGAAAVANYQMANVANQKMKSGDDSWSLEMVKTPDIIAEVAALKEYRPFIVGFSAETHDLLAHAKEKLQRKNLDVIIANHISDKKGMGSDTNAVTILYKKGEPDELPETSKQLLARQILTLLQSRFK